MRVVIHDREEELPAGTTVKQLLARLELERAACAVAVNHTHVPRSEHTRPLREGDHVEILAPMQGG